MATEWLSSKEAAHRLVELDEARQRARLGGDVGSVYDDVVRHNASSQPRLRPVRPDPASGGATARRYHRRVKTDTMTLRLKINLIVAALFSLLWLLIDWLCRGPRVLAW